MNTRQLEAVKNAERVLGVIVDRINKGKTLNPVAVNRYTERVFEDMNEEILEAEQ